MTRIKKITVVLGSLCLMLIILVGCTNGKQYFEQGTEVNIQDFCGDRTIVFEFDENSLGEEYAEKYNNFCKDSSEYPRIYLVKNGNRSSLAGDYRFFCITTITKK